MKRRQLLAGAGALLALPLVPSFAASAKEPFKRVRPGDAAWPPPEEWKALGEKLEGQLFQPQSLFASCAAGAQAPECVQVLKNIRNPYYIGDQPSGTQVCGWFGAWAPAPSAYVIQARSAQDVSHGVKFAAKHRLRLAVKGGGHSYQGTSTSADSLLIWTRAMNEISVHDAFVSRDCPSPPTPAVSVGAGCMWMDVYDAVTTKAGRYVQGGGCATVGVAGLVQSGGFGSFSKGFGSAAASLLEAEVVTADGEIRTVNRCRDPELFWALKGGGGGSFGVVTRLTLRTHDLPLLGGAGGKVRAKKDEDFRALVARFVDFYAGSLFNPHWGETVKINRDNMLEVSMTCQGLESKAADDAWKPFFDWAREHGHELFDDPGAGATNGRLWWDAQARKKRGSDAVIFDERPGAISTHAWWRDDQDQVGAFIHGYGSVWLPSSGLEPGNRARLADALFAASRHMEIQLHFNKGLGGASEAAREASRDTATNPAMIDAFALAIVATGSGPRYPGMPGSRFDEAEARAHAAAIGRAMQELWRVAPEKGSYVSESDYFDAGWQRAFWGANYERLLAIKLRYDPDGLFYVHHGVGSEHWSEGGFERIS